MTPHLLRASALGGLGCPLAISVTALLGWPTAATANLLTYMINGTETITDFSFNTPKVFTDTISGTFKFDTVTMNETNVTITVTGSDYTGYNGTYTEAGPTSEMTRNITAELGPVTLTLTFASALGSPSDTLGGFIFNDQESTDSTSGSANVVPVPAPRIGAGLAGLATIVFATGFWALAGRRDRGRSSASCHEAA